MAWGGNDYVMPGHRNGTPRPPPHPDVLATEDPRIRSGDPWPAKWTGTEEALAGRQAPRRRGVLQGAPRCFNSKVLQGAPSCSISPWADAGSPGARGLGLQRKRVPFNSAVHASHPGTTKPLLQSPPMSGVGRWQGEVLARAIVGYSGAAGLGAAVGNLQERRLRHPDGAGRPGHARVTPGKSHHAPCMPGFRRRPAKVWCSTGPGDPEGHRAIGSTGRSR